MEAEARGHRGPVPERSRSDAASPSGRAPVRTDPRSIGCLPRPPIRAGGHGGPSRERADGADVLCYDAGPRGSATPNAWAAASTCDTPCDSTERSEAPVTTILSKLSA